MEGRDKTAKQSGFAMKGVQKEEQASAYASVSNYGSLRGRGFNYSVSGYVPTQGLVTCAYCDWCGCGLLHSRQWDFMVRWNYVLIG